MSGASRSLELSTSRTSAPGACALIWSMTPPTAPSSFIEIMPTVSESFRLAGGLRATITVWNESTPGATDVSMPSAGRTQRRYAW